MDTNEGNAFPAPLLRSWRDLHEYRTRLEQGGYARPSGWVQSIQIQEHYLFRPGVMQLSRGNLLIGENGVGKTHLLQLLRGMTTPRPLMDGHRNLSCTISWFDPDLRTAKIGVTGKALEYQVDGKRVHLPPRPYRVLDISPHRPRPHSHGIGSLAEFLGVDEWTAGSVASTLPEVMPAVFSRVSVAGENLKVEYCEGNGEESSFRWMMLPFRALAAFAELQAQSEPTVLILDEPFDHLYFRAVMEVMRIFDSPSWSFQTIISTHSPAAFEWSQRGWTATVLLRDESLTSRISQDPLELENIRENYRRAAAAHQARVAPR
ncbi:AAA family ATPase (plasmid) [Streptomyces sp. JL4002]|uniref:AAA family ATPase n=1 Tax=Streptomyces sp. JL4002 TaxID=3404781 RepID=UPI003B28A136